MGEGGGGGAAPLEKASLAFPGRGPGLLGPWGSGLPLTLPGCQRGLLACHPVPLVGKAGPASRASGFPRPLASLGRRALAEQTRGAVAVTEAGRVPPGWFLTGLSPE